MEILKTGTVGRRLQYLVEVKEGLSEKVKM